MKSALNSGRGGGGQSGTDVLTEQFADSVVLVMIDAVSEVRLFDETVQQGAGMSDPFAVIADCTGVL